ncbi:DUF916 and DUF3324 domain-containing protein [Enterococcus sp. LJL128]
MIKKAAIKLVSLVYIISMLAGFSTMASAAETQQELKGFSYKVVLPENQHNPDVGYYDLRMTPSQQQTIQMQLNNSSDKEITIMVSLNGAKTNSNGVIEYGENEIENDASLKYDFADIVKAPEEVVVPANSSEMLNMEITMPEASFEGYISGAVTIQEKDAEGQETNTDQGMIVNKLAYQTGILLSEADSNELSPDMKLNRVYPELNNFRNAIFVNFSNVQPVYTDDMTVDVQIMGKDSDEVLYDTKKANMRMAPNSMIDFPVSMNGERMTPGDYRAKILVTTKAGGKWQWEENFKITDEEADKFNEQDLTLVQDAGINWQLIIMIVGGLLLLILIIFLVIRLLKKKNKQNKRKKASSKRKKKK